MENEIWTKDKTELQHLYSHKYVHIFLAGVEGTEEVTSSLLLNDQVVGYIALCRIILLLPNLRASSPLMEESRGVTRERHVMWGAIPLARAFSRGPLHWP